MPAMVTVKQNEKAWSKEEEMQVLREFVNQLQEGSYLKGILKGIDEYAECQIQNDWGLSVMGELEEARHDLLKTQSGLAQAVKAQTEMQERLNQMAADMFKLQREVDCLARERCAEAKVRREAQDECDRLTAELERQAAEITRLKARLFDYIEKGHGAA